MDVGRLRLGFFSWSWGSRKLLATSMPSSSHVAWDEAGEHSLDRGAHRRMPTIELHQRRAVVTGAAQGIGRAIAARLLTAGAAVCLWDQAPEVLTSTAHNLRTLGTVEAV